MQALLKGVAHVVIWSDPPDIQGRTACGFYFAWDTAPEWLLILDVFIYKRVDAAPNCFQCVTTFEKPLSA